MLLLDRDAWSATLDLGPPMVLPAQGLHVHHSVTLADDDHNLLATGDVAADMREIEHIGDQRFGRFPYSWCIHPTGWIGEGAGRTIGAHTAGYNSTSFGVCFIGNYDVDRLPDAAVDAFRELRHQLVANGDLVRDHYVKPHRARKATACPGGHTIARWGDLLAPFVPPTTTKDLLDMAFMVKNPKGAHLLVTGNASLLVTSPQMVTHHMAAGIRVVDCDDNQFSRYAKLRVDLDHVHQTEV